MSGKRPTLADVAHRAGTSTAVVSYVLNNGPRPVSELLRVKVIRAIDELNYRPDGRARALRRPRRWQQIGLLVPDLTLPLFGEFVGRIEVEARARHHLTLIGNTGYDPERELEFVTAFAEVGVDGLLVVGAVNAPHTANLCRRERIPVVWMHNIRGAIETDIIGVDHVHAGELIARHLLDIHDCRDVAFVGGVTAGDVRHGDRETVQQRFEGVASVVGHSLPHIRTDLTPAGAYGAVAEYLHGSAPPQAFVVGTYGQTAATIRAIADAGLRIPGDIRVVGFDGAAADYGRLRLTTVQQPVDVLAREALGRLLGDSPRADDGFVPTLRVGETCGCAASPTG
ncbi:LacI family DNA-binding transcriptional regulator [Mycolicibacterium lutetiense]|uniref:LacI family transcriptional regulator n=1 Tax=Mycolicibacterium lutetiense TaxID=1641992 RepID=A0ABS4ZYI9_9MYCO|nr:LacI family DNA-binding transcriptional regulator [Mycolicibacterium lutetiense]MBP2454575.1 LacI family transcriptional regulator [Mycolicibacterium lutetiense]